MFRLTHSRFPLFTISLFCLADICRGTTLPAGFRETTVVEDVTAATTLGFAPDGRMFVCLQNGELRTVVDGKLSAKPILKVDADDRGEHGLVGIAFDPDFSQNHFVYLKYIAKSPTVHSRISRFELHQDQAGPETILWETGDLGASIFHVGGMIAFGPDGKLYFGQGDNAGFPFVDNAQRLDVPFGKLYRMNRDGSIPTDNPFYASTSGPQRAIWAIGLRNPYSFDFQPKANRLFINDVGESSWEEIDEGIAGQNYGWPAVEGPSTDSRFRAPLFAYAHGPVTSDTQGCAIVGGLFYSPAKPQFPSQYQDQYFFVDYCNNWIHTMNPTTREVKSFAQNLGPNPTTLKLGPDGSLYYYSKWQEGIYRISYGAR